ncbi:MAG: hypothetical protein Q8Q73_17180 [Stagnimonas sp.]|nr:hypothetical protein [Stagnimonas sp.]
MFEVMDEKPDPAPRWQMALGGLPDLGTALACWLSWQQPEVLGAAWVKLMVITVLAEFFVIHSGGFMATFGNMPASRLGRIGAHLGLASFYFLFIFALAHSLDAPWLYGMFAWLFLSKLLVSWSANRGARLAIREQMIDWPFAVAAYLLSLGAGFIQFESANGGINEQVFVAAGLVDAGLFEDRPWTALAAGSIYFTAMGLYRMRLWRWLNVAA